MVKLVGPINEHFERLSLVMASTGGVVILDLDDVPWITSFGVREWVWAIKEIPRTYLAFINVRPIVMQQFNMVSSFAGDGELVSFYAPYVCAACGGEQDELIDLLELYPKVKNFELPEVACRTCGAACELDELPETYLMFAAAARPPNPPPDYHAVLRGEAALPANRQPLKVRKEVEGALTILGLEGDLDRRAPLKRAAAGLEGTVIVSFQGLHSFDDEGVARVRSLWADSWAQFFLTAIPVSIAQTILPDLQKQTGPKVLSIRADLGCAAGHVLKQALIDGEDVRRGNLSCPVCAAVVSAPGLAALATAGAFAPLTPETTALRTEVRARALRAMAAAIEEPMPEEQFGRYTLLRRLGSGGMAEVFLAQQSGLAGFEKHVVLKRILPHLNHDPAFVKMFLQEARVAARVHHSNVVQIYDVGQVEDVHFIAMEYVEGWDLSQIMSFAMSAQRPFPLHIAARICAEIGHALRAAHGVVDSRGNPAPIIHRDVSPHNILLSVDGAVKLTDFGIAKAIDGATLTPTSTIKGKIGYLAPETVLGRSRRVDVRADLFSMGVIMWELLALDRLFRRDSDYAMLHAVLHAPIPPLRERRPEVPIELVSIVQRALARDPEQRFQSAGALVDALEAFLAGCEGKASAAALADHLRALAATAALPHVTAHGDGATSVIEGTPTNQPIVDLADEHPTGTGS